MHLFEMSIVLFDRRNPVFVGHRGPILTNMLHVVSMREHELKGQAHAHAHPFRPEDETPSVSLT